MDSKGTIKTTVLNYGLIMGGLSIAFTLMLFLMDMHYQNSSIQQWTGLLIMSGSIIFGQLNFKKINVSKKKETRYHNTGIRGYCALVKKKRRKTF